MTKPKISPLRLLLPLWRLGSNVRSAGEDEIGELSDGAVVAEWCFAAIVVIGIIGEFIIAARHPAYDSWWGQWGPAFGDLLVAGGVAGEVVASVLSHLCQGELTRRSTDRLAQVEFDAGFTEENLAKATVELAETQRELANALKEITYLRKSRRAVLAGNEERFVAAISPFAGTKFDVGHGPEGFREQWDFCWDIEPLFVKAGWVFADWQSPTGLVALKPNNWGPTPRGYMLVNVLNVTIELHPVARDILLPAAKALADALNDIGIAANIEDSIIAAASLNFDAVHFLVGMKT